MSAALNEGVIGLDGGSGFSLALKADGTVLSWGSNFGSRQLGTGSTADREDPTPLPGIGGATAISAGRDHSLVIAGGNVYAFGGNTYGQLGTPTSTTCSSGFTCSPTPVQNGLSGAKAVAAANGYSLVVLNDGTVRSFGLNNGGALGDGTTVNRRETPVQVVGPGGQGVLGGIVAVAGGENHSLALAADGTVYAWGGNGQGQLGLGAPDTNNHLTPTQVPGLSGITAIAAGYRHSLALRNDGVVFAFGQNIEGQLGNGQLGNNNPCGCFATPAPVNGLGGITAIAAGNYFSLAVRNDGLIFGFGDNGSYQLGLTEPAQVPTATQVPGIKDVTLVAAGSQHSLALQAVVTPTFTLTVEVGGPGTVELAPIGGRYPQGTQVTLTPRVNAGSDALFTGWTIDGQPAGHAVPLAITMDQDHTVRATFASPPSFCDVKSGDLYYEAIRQLAARGVIRGVSTADKGLCFQPEERTLRAQMAALIARPLGWEAEDGANPFTDRGAVDAALWRNVGTLARYNVARGYSPEGCRSLGKQAPCYGPTDPVLHAQTISFITRGMVAKGYWTQQPENPALYPNVPASSGHRQDIATYVHYAGLIPGTASAGQAWGPWDQPSTRGWFAEAEWRALDSYFRLDRTP